MSVMKRLNPHSKTNEDTGFSNTGNINGGRFINRDGSFNLSKKGRPFWDRISVFYNMLSIPVWQFIGVILLFYIAINFLYTLVYFWLGQEQFTGLIFHSQWGIFKELFFFSTQTFTTVGYGRINPVGAAANFVASLEALNGFLSFAIATGLIYGRFARPRGLMFRFACFKEHHALSDVTVQVNLAMLIQEDGQANYKYYVLALERSHIENLPMNWTVVHPIDEQSPLVGFSEEDLRAADVELYVTVRGFNDVYSSTVQQRTSYTFQEIKMNRRFVPMYQETETGTILELHKLSKSVAL